MHVLVFDSGVGGLSVVAELRALMPDLYLSYVSDDEFRPYGSKTVAALNARLPGLLKTLCLMLKPDAVVIACNTASTTALGGIRAELDIPVIGVVPAIKPAALMSQTKAIAVLGTPRTVAHKYVDNLISEFAPNCRVILHGSTKLVELAELKLSGSRVNQSDIDAEIAPIFSSADARNIDTIVLACTHFPLLQEEIVKACPPGVTLIDNGAAIARRTEFVLKNCLGSDHLKAPQAAFLIGGHDDQSRAKAFADYGFKKTVALAGMNVVPNHPTGEA